MINIMNNIVQLSKTEIENILSTSEIEKTECGEISCSGGLGQCKESCKPGCQPSGKNSCDPSCRVGCLAGCKPSCQDSNK